jgi:hydroxymethylpyrimidine pyrophosphatase-like HAD family hydrolase
MTDLIATDLDRTLIYSQRARALGTDDAPVVCVEMQDGRPASYMTASAAAAFRRLAASRLVVPVTTRVLDQYRRVLLPGPPPRFAVAANGGALLVDGQVDDDWTRRVGRTLIGTFPLARVWDYVGQVCRPEFTVQVRNASDLFCYAVVRRSRLPVGFVDDVSAWAAERGWRTSLQGRKLYWVPEALTKSAAVLRIADRAGCHRVLAAGDSLLDVELLLGADLGIHPGHGELHAHGWSAPTVTSTTARGIAAGEQIVAWFATHTALGCLA